MPAAFTKQLLLRDELICGADHRTSLIVVLCRPRIVVGRFHQPRHIVVSEFAVAVLIVQLHAVKGVQLNRTLFTDSDSKLAWICIWICDAWRVTRKLQTSVDHCESQHSCIPTVYNFIENSDLVCRLSRQKSPRIDFLKGTVCSGAGACSWTLGP